MRLHSLWRGLQSVLFYYLSCTPWFKFTSRRKRKRDNQRDLQLQAAYELEDPEAYRHPTAYRTNPYWDTEIKLGPGPPERRLTKKQRQTRKRLETTESRGNTPVSDHPAGNTAIQGADGVAAYPSIPEEESWRKNQRVDEALWGSENTAPSPPNSQHGSAPSRSTTRFPTFYSAEGPTAYETVAVNPPVSDLHPPVVVNPAQGKHSNMWMLQPPPPASIMSGHESPARSRSTTRTTTSSASSRRTGERQLARKLSKRLIEEKLHRSSLLFPNEKPWVLRLPNAPSQSSLIEASYFESKTRSLQGQRDASDDSNKTVVHSTSSTMSVEKQHELTARGVAVGVLPWQRHEKGTGTLHQDWALHPSRTLAIQRSSTISNPSPGLRGNVHPQQGRPKTAKPHQLSTIIGSSSEHHEESVEICSGSVAQDQTRDSDQETKRRYQDMTSLAARQLPSHDREISELGRRWSVDF